MKLGFEASCGTNADEEFIASSPWVYADDKGYFITVETDSHEGSAQMTLPAAKKVYAALGQAIAFAEEKRGRDKKV